MSVALRHELNLSGSHQLRAARAPAQHRFDEAVRKWNQLAWTGTRLGVSLELNAGPVGERDALQRAVETASGAWAARSDGSVASSTANPWFWLEMIRARCRDRSPGGSLRGDRTSFFTVPHRSRVRATGGRGRCRRSARRPPGSSGSTRSRSRTLRRRGPFERNTPSGLSASTSGRGVCAGTTVIRHPCRQAAGRMLRLMP